MLELQEKHFGDKQKEFIIGDRENGKNDEKIKAVYAYCNLHGLWKA